MRYRFPQDGRAISWVFVLPVLVLSSSLLEGQAISVDLVFMEPRPPRPFIFEGEQIRLKMSIRNDRKTDFCFWRGFLLPVPCKLDFIMHGPDGRRVKENDDHKRRYRSCVLDIQSGPARPRADKAIGPYEVERIAPEGKVAAAIQLLPGAYRLHEFGRYKFKVVYDEDLDYAVADKSGSTYHVERLKVESNSIEFEYVPLTKTKQIVERDFECVRYRTVPGGGRELYTENPVLLVAGYQGYFAVICKTEKRPLRYLRVLDWEPRDVVIRQREKGGVNITLQNELLKRSITVAYGAD